MRKLTFIMLLFCIGCSGGNGEKPTKEQVIAVMRSVWDKPQTNINPGSKIDVNDITFGSSEKANYAQQLEGVPENALITNAKIDFTENIFYTDGTQHVRRIMTAWVYKDKFNQWAVMDIGTVYPGK